MTDAPEHRTVFMEYISLKKPQVRPFQPQKYMTEGTIQYIEWPIPNIYVILPNVNINYLDTISVYSRSKIYITDSRQLKSNIYQS